MSATAFTFEKAIVSCADASTRGAAASVALAISLSLPPALSQDMVENLQNVSSGFLLDSHRSQIAAVVSMAVHVGVISPNEAVSTLESNSPEDIYALCEKAIVQFDEWLCADLSALSLESADSDVGLSFQGGDSADPCLEISQSGLVNFNCDLSGLDEPLACVVQSALELISRLGDYVFVSELMDMSYHVSETMDDYERLLDTGLFEQSIEEAHQWADDHCDGFSGLELQEFEQVMATQAAWHEWRMPADFSLFAPENDDEPMYERLIRTVWGWRKSNPSLYRSPWARFIRLCAHYARQHSVSPLASITVHSGYEGVHPLGYGRVISVGEPWADEVMSDFHFRVMETGEYFADYLSVKDVAVEALVGKLRYMAISQGLISFLTGVLYGNDANPID